MSTLSIETKTATVEFKGTGVYEVIFATKRDASGELVIDHHGDVYADDAVGQQGVIVGCWNHSDACPGPAGIGATFETRLDIRAKGRLFIETQHGADERARWLALGDRLKFSYRFSILDHDFIEVRGRRVRRLKSLNVISIDAVDNPAGLGTGLVNLKSSCSCGCGGSCGELSDAEKSALLEVRDRVKLLRQRDAFQAVQVKQTLAGQRRRFEQSRPPLARPEGKFRWVEDRPSEGTEAGAIIGVALASQVYEIAAPPHIRYFHPAGPDEKADFTTDSDIWGRSYPKDRTNYIWLRHDLDQPTATKVAFHEVTHRSYPDASEEEVERRTRVIEEFIAAGGLR